MGTDGSCLELERTDGHGREVELDVRVDGQCYSGSTSAWLDLGQVADLRELERVRQGRATFQGTSPENLWLEFYSTDPLGHMAVRGHLGWTTPLGFLWRVGFGFPFEPDRLPGVVHFFERL